RINALLPKARPRNLRSDGLQSPKPTSKMPAGEDDDGPSFADLYKQRLEVGEPQGFGPAFAPFEREFSARPSIPTRPGPRSDRATAAAVPGAAPPPPALLASRREPHLPQSDGAPREPLEATSRLPDVDNLVGTLIAETAPSFGETSALGKFDGDASVDDDRIFESWRDRIRARIRHLERDGTITSERAELLLAQFEGHHYFPQQIFNHLDLSPDAREAFRQGTTGLTDRHVNDAAHRQYTAAVREMWEQWVRERGINPAQMTRAQAEEFLRAIRSSTNPTIRNFNNEIRFRQIPALRNGLRWWRGR
ncbi:MAG: hypothetical protein JNL66_08230, partial [Alphaproteobacteria bacterium]|nr:hypothetical protein [Alphaproteobacteria bacterium]